MTTARAATSVLGRGPFQQVALTLGREEYDQTLQIALVQVGVAAPISVQ